LSSVAVIAGALIILFTGSSIADPVLSFVIVAVILFGSVRLITDSLHILMDPHQSTLTSMNWSRQ